MSGLWCTKRWLIPDRYGHISSASSGQRRQYYPSHVSRLDIQSSNVAWNKNHLNYFVNSDFFSWDSSSRILKVETALTRTVRRLQDYRARQSDRRARRIMEDHIKPSRKNETITGPRVLFFSVPVFLSSFCLDYLYPSGWRVELGRFGISLLPWRTELPSALGDFWTALTYFQKSSNTLTMT